MAETRNYDLIIIGAGPAGVNAALTAGIFGQKVVVVEKNPAVGGAGANTGTLPSKTLRETALALSGLRSRQLYGVDLSLRRQATVPELLFHERMVKHAEQSQILSLFERVGVPLERGAARFLDSHTVAVTSEGGAEEAILRGDKIIIAIGSSPVQPAIFPFHHHRVWDSDQVVDMPEIPKSMAVIGAGVIGSEYACTFQALGVEVDIIDGRDTLLPFLDWEVSQALAKSMTDCGIRFRWEQKVEACEATDDKVTLTLSSGECRDYGAVLVAAGRASHTEALDPDRAGLLLGKRGLVPVNTHFQTNIPHIYAVGDVIGFPALASTSAEQGRVAACHACGSSLVKEMPELLPTGVYTIPEVGMVGETEGHIQSRLHEEALKGEDYVVGRARYSDNARGKIIGDSVGFLKLIFRKSDMKLLGVHVIGEQASEVVHIGLMVMRAGGDPDLLLHTCFNYPTLGTMYKYATYDALLARKGSRTLSPTESVGPTG